MTDIVTTQDLMGGQSRLDGHRISVPQFVEWVHEDGTDPETIATGFELDLPDVYRATYCEDNIEEMTEWRQRRNERIQESRDQQSSPDTA